MISLFQNQNHIASQNLNPQSLTQCPCYPQLATCITTCCHLFNGPIEAWEISQPSHDMNAYK